MARYYLSILSVLCVLALVVAGYSFYLYYNLPAQQEQRELRHLMEAIGGGVDLPSLETPRLISVNDENKSESRVFFQKAESGDKILLYQGGRRAILYRPSLARVVDMASMVKKIDIAQKSPTEQATASGALVIFNGAGDQLLVDRVEASIREKFPSIDISDVRDALKSNYPSSVVIDITGKNSNLVSAVAQTIGGYVSDIVPVGETAPVSDILVIVGEK
jgi:hypothetical protein